MKKKLRRLAISATLVILLMWFLIGTFSSTGLLQANVIDDRDLAAWEYDEDGVIVGAREFVLNSSYETCWYLIHGYTSTPDEMRYIAEEIHSEFNETVVVTRLKGSGEVPSHLLNLSLYDWYDQVSEEYDELESKCDNVNLVGFSFGGALAARLAETKDVNNVYLLSPYLFATYRFYMILRPEIYVDTLSDAFVYIKKSKIGQIFSEEDLADYIAYWNRPLQPVKSSKPFFEEVKEGLGDITAPILLQQSKNDETSDIDSSIYIYDRVGSEIKEIVVFKDSNHVIPEDYDKEEATANIIRFEKEIRAYS